MIDVVDKIKGELSIKVRDKVSGEVLKELNESNFMSYSWRRMILDNIISYVSSETVLPKNSSYCCRRGTNKVIKPCMVLTDNDKVYEDKKGLKDVEGNIIAMTSGLKAVGTSTDNFIERVDFVEGGGIEYTGVFRGGKGKVSGVNLAISSDFDFNKNGVGLYSGAVGELVHTEQMSKYTSNVACSSSFVDYENYIWTAFSYSSVATVLVRIDKETGAVAHKIYSKSENRGCVRLQGGKLYLYTKMNEVIVIDKDMNDVEVIEGFYTTSSALDSYGCCFTHYDELERKFYVVGKINTSSGPSNFLFYTMDRKDAVGAKYTSVRIQGKDAKLVERVFYGTYYDNFIVRDMYGNLYDMSAIKTAKVDTDLSDILVLLDKDESRKGHRVEIIDGVKWSWFVNSSYVLNHLNVVVANSLYSSMSAPDKYFYICKEIGGNALTHVKLSESIDKTDNNELVINYKIK